MEWRLAMQRIVDNPALIERMRQQINRPITVDQHVDGLLDIYDSALQTQPGPDRDQFS
jgi:hypothetical protein